MNESNQAVPELRGVVSPVPDSPEDNLFTLCAGVAGREISNSIGASSCIRTKAIKEGRIALKIIQIISTILPQTRSPMPLCALYKSGPTP